MKNAFFQNEWLLILLLVAATVLVYAGTLRNGFIWDDDDNIYGNPVLTSPGGLKRVWGSFVSTQQYYPLLYTAFFLENKLWKLQPAGYHLTSFLLHAVNAVLLYFLLKRLGLSPALSWLTALFFAVHPVQVESVAWATEMKNVLSGFFYFSAFLSFLKYDDTRKRRYYWLSLFLFVLALLSKTVTATLAPALVLAAWLRRRLNLRLVREIIPFFLLGLAMGLLTYFIEKHLVGASGTEWNLSLSQRILLIFTSFWFYVGKVAFPHRLCFIYPRWEINLFSLSAYVPLLASALFILIVFKWRKNMNRYAVFGLLYFFVTIAPALGLFDLYVHRYTFVTDHFQYLACWGLIMIGLLAVRELISRSFPPRSRILISSLLAIPSVGLCLVLSTMECRKYKDQEVLWTRVIATTPASWMAYNNLGKYFFSTRQLEKSIECFQKAIDLKPDHARAYHNLGLAYLRLEKPRSALLAYQNAVRLNPNYFKAYNGIGIAYCNLNQPREALDNFQRALKIKPDFVEAHYNLSLLYQALQVPSLSQRHLEIYRRLSSSAPLERKRELE